MCVCFFVKDVKFLPFGRRRELDATVLKPYMHPLKLKNLIKTKPQSYLWLVVSLVLSFLSVSMVIFSK